MSYVSVNKLREYRQIGKDWDGCTKCKIGRWAQSKCHVRGKIPCDILLIGEGPGRMENLCGEPFVGAAGRLLDKWLNTLCEIEYPNFTELLRFAVTNIVACRPCDSKQDNNRPPTIAETKRCAPHLEQVIKLCDPQGIVLLGNAPRALYTPAHRFIQVYHPAYVLRKGGIRTKESNLAIEVIGDFIRKVVVPF